MFRTRIFTGVTESDERAYRDPDLDTRQRASQPKDTPKPPPKTRAAPIPTPQPAPAPAVRSGHRSSGSGYPLATTSNKPPTVLTGRKNKNGEIARARAGRFGFF